MSQYNPSGQDCLNYTGVSVIAAYQRSTAVCLACDKALSFEFCPMAQPLVTPSAAAGKCFLTTGAMYKYIFAQI